MGPKKHAHQSLRYDKMTIAHSHNHSTYRQKIQLIEPDEFDRVGVLGNTHSNIQLKYKSDVL